MKAHFYASTTNLLNYVNNLTSPTDFTINHRTNLAILAISRSPFFYRLPPCMYNWVWRIMRKDRWMTRNIDRCGKLLTVVNLPPRFRHPPSWLNYTIWRFVPTVLVSVLGSVEGKEKTGPPSSSPRHPPVDQLCRFENFYYKIDQTKQKYWNPRSKIGKDFYRRSLCSWISEDKTKWQVKNQTWKKWKIWQEC